MVNIVQPTFRLFLLWSLLFWTQAVFAELGFSSNSNLALEKASESAISSPTIVSPPAASIVQDSTPATTPAGPAAGPAAATLIPTPTETQTPTPATNPAPADSKENQKGDEKMDESFDLLNDEGSDFFGFKRKHSLIYLQSGSGQGVQANSKATKNIELGYEKSENKNLKWGPYFARTMTSLDESFTYPSTGYYENRSSELTLLSMGLHARRDLFRYINVVGSLGVTMSSLEVVAVDTNAPLQSSAIGYKEKYPVGVEWKLSLQASKSFSKVGIAADMTYQQTAVGMSHSLSIISANVLLRYFFNR